MLTFTQLIFSRLRAAGTRTADRGASLVEYAMLVMLIAVVCLVAITAIGTKTAVPLSSTASSLGAN